MRWFVSSFPNSALPTAILLFLILHSPRRVQADEDSHEHHKPEDHEESHGERDGEHKEDRQRQRPQQMPPMMMPPQQPPPPPPGMVPPQGNPPVYSYLRPFTPMWTGQATTQAPKSDVCPCVHHPDTNECMMFDPRYMASTVEDAILYFPDLQMPYVDGGAIGSRPITPAPPINDGVVVDGATSPGGNGEILPPPPGAASTLPNATVPLVPPTEANMDLQSIAPSPNNNAAKSRVGGPTGVAPTLCDQDAECAECSAILVNRLGTSGLLQGEEMNRVSRRFGLDNNATSRRSYENTYCQKYHFAKVAHEKSIIYGGPNATGPGSGGGAAETADKSTSDPELDELVKKLREKGERKWQERQEKERAHNVTGSHDLRRNKRQATAAKNTTTIGQQFKIDCSKRGDPVEQGSNWIGLCNVCWAWRKLPATYFPQYVNELICDADTKCMSGFATCQQRYKSVDILQNTGTDANPKWKQVTISVANYCDCEVESGSSLHNFVAA